MLNVNNVSVRLGGRVILSPLSWGFAPGRITALVGPNGSGKSTLLRLLSGLLAPDQGLVRLHKRPVGQWPRQQLARQLALLPQRNQVPAAVRVAELVAYGRYPYRGWLGHTCHGDSEMIAWAMAQAGVTPLADRPVEVLSGGELQRVWLAMVLAQDTDILMLDEPTAWLDLAHQQGLLASVRRLNREHGKTIIWVLHDLNQALHYSHEALMLQQGTLVAAGEVAEVLQPERIARVWETPITLGSVEGRPLIWPKEVQDGLA